MYLARILFYRFIRLCRVIECYWKVVFSDRCNEFWWNVKILSSKIFFISIFFIRIADIVKILLSTNLSGTILFATIIIGIVGIARIGWDQLSSFARMLKASSIGMACSMLRKMGPSRERDSNIVL